jgi:hypothetical protein
MERCGTMTVYMPSSRLSSIRVEIIVHIKIVINGCQFYIELDFLRIRGLEIALGELFNIRSCAMGRFLY